MSHFEYANLSSPIFIVWALTYIGTTFLYLMNTFHFSVVVFPQLIVSDCLIMMSSIFKICLYWLSIIRCAGVLAKKGCASWCQSQRVIEPEATGSDLSETLLFHECLNLFIFGG